MWFAALGSYQQNPWLISMTYQLLRGDKYVKGFLDPSSPWQKSSPKYIRGILYRYHFTSYKS